MKPLTWNRSLRSWTLAVGVTAGWYGEVLMLPQNQTVAHAADGVAAASVEEATKILDLRKISLPDGAVITDGSHAVMMNYETKAGLKEAFQFQQQQLLKQGFKELAGTQREATYCMGSFTKNGFTVSLMSYPDMTNPAQAVTRVFITHFGNVPAEQVPVIKESKRVLVSPGGANYSTPLKAAEAAAATRKVLTAAGWEPYGSNPIPPESEVQTYKLNAIRLTAYIAPAPDQGPLKGSGMMINYSLQLMSADIPAPEDAEQVGFSDSIKTLNFETASEFADVATFYQQRLAKSGWKPTTDELIEQKDRFDQPTASQVFRNAANDMLVLDLQRRSDKTVAKVAHLTATEFAAVEQKQKAAAEKLVAERKAREEQMAARASNKKSKTEKPAKTDDGLPDIEATANAAIADALKGTGISIKLGKEAAPAKTKPNAALEAAKAEAAKKIKNASKDTPANEPKTEGKPQKDLASLAPRDNAGQITLDDKDFELKHATAYEMKRRGQAVTKVILSSKPLKQSALLAALKEKGNDEDFNLPEPSVTIELDERDRPNSMSLRADRKSLGVSSSNLVGEAVVAEGRARGSFKMNKDGEFFDTRYRASLSFDVPVLTKDSKPAKQLTDAPKLETIGKMLADGKTIKLANVVAYETKVFDERRVAIFFTEKPINLAKLKDSLKKNGTDDGLFEVQPQVKVEIDKNDRPAMMRLWVNNVSLNSNADLVGDVIIEDGRARGTVKLGKPAEFFDKEYSFELTFDVDVILLPSE